MSLATSRRTPSNPDRTTAPGVSSMMKSTPVRFSSARMLRPSRPMIRPFMSSAESWTTETVVSVAWPAASRCMHTERMLRTRRSASRLVSSSIWRSRRAASCRACSSISLEQQLLGARRRHSRHLLERALELLALVGERLALLLELLLPSREVVLTARQRGTPLGQLPTRLVGVPGTPPSSQRGGSVRASVDERRDHHCNRDQRCGTDDLHGRPLRLTRAAAQASFCFGLWERPNGSCGARTDAGSAASALQAAARCLSLWDFRAGQEARWRSPSTLKSGIQRICKFAGFLSARRPFVR